MRKGSLASCVICNKSLRKRYATKATTAAVVRIKDILFNVSDALVWFVSSTQGIYPNHPVYLYAHPLQESDKCIRLQCGTIQAVGIGRRLLLRVLTKSIMRIRLHAYDKLAGSFILPHA